MKSGALRLLLTWLVFLPACVLADGGFIPASAFERVRIPDQRALLHFDASNETLVIDSAFKGNGTNFAWIIPAPSVPIVEPATTGLFSTLQILFRSRIVHDVPKLYWFWLILGLLIAYAGWRRRRGESIIGMLVLVAFLALLSSMLLPALGTASIAVSSSQVTVVERKRVGVYDTAILQSADGQAVFDWLRQNGFATRTNFIPAIRAYAKAGWCFVASKLHTETPLQEAANAHPLTLIFKTDRAVYPLCLTGIDNEPCHIELYVFGPSRAEIPNFTVERCGTPSYPTEAPRLAPMDNLQIRHPLLRSFTADSRAATKLVGTLTSRQMQQDAYVTWSSLKEKRLARFSSQGAVLVAVNIAAPVFAVGLLGLLWSRWARQDDPSRGGRARKISALLCVAALVGSGIIYLCLPKVRATVSRAPRVRMWILHDSVAGYLTQSIAEHQRKEPAGPRPDLHWVRQQLAENGDVRRALPERYQTNLFTGELCHEEDSPGNYTLREGAEGEIDYVSYDIDGGEKVVPLNPEREAASKR